MRSMRSVRHLQALVASILGRKVGLQMSQASGRDVWAPIGTANATLWHSTTTGAEAKSAQTHVKALPPNNVVIAGAGPAGLTTALLLQKYGVQTVVLEQNSQLTDHPQAHYINHRTMEIFRGMDGLAKEVEALMPPLCQWRQFVYCTFLLGDVLGTVDHFKGQRSPHSSTLSPEPVAHLPQNRLLPLLARRAAAYDDDIQLRMGARVTRVVPTIDGKALHVTVKPEGGDEYTLLTKYLVAADGAHSSIRKSAGIRMMGPGTIQHLVNIHFTSIDLGRRLLRENRKGMLYFVFNKDVIAVIVAHDLEGGEFVAQVPYFPPLQSPTEFTVEECKSLIQKFVGVEGGLDVQVKTIRPWAMRAAVAEHYSAYNDRAFFVGDAAHVVPPAGAFGMNTGIQDAHNLAWKLALSVKGISEQLLKTYENERMPVAEANMQLSIQNFDETLQVARVMGLDYNLANSISNALSSQSLQYIPAQLRRQALMTMFEAGRVAGSAVGQLRRSRLKQLFETGETLRLQYPKEDLGFVYGSQNSAVAVALSHPNVTRKSVGASTDRNAPYLPALVPGGRLPHVPLIVERVGNLPGIHRGDKISSVDLSACRGARFTLLLSGASRQCLYDWIAAWRLWLDGHGPGGALELNPIVIVQSAELTEQLFDCSDERENVTFLIDSSGLWKALDPFGKAGLAVVVRPDGHIAWLHESSIASGVDDALATLDNVFRVVLKY